MNSTREEMEQGAEAGGGFFPSSSGGRTVWEGRGQPGLLNPGSLNDVVTPTIKRRPLSGANFYKSSLSSWPTHLVLPTVISQHHNNHIPGEYVQPQGTRQPWGTLASQLLTARPHPLDPHSLPLVFSLGSTF